MTIPVIYDTEAIWARRALSPSRDGSLITRVPIVSLVHGRKLPRNIFVIDEDHGGYYLSGSRHSAYNFGATRIWVILGKLTKRS